MSDEPTTTEPTPTPDPEPAPTPTPKDVAPKDDPKPEPTLTQEQFNRELQQRLQRERDKFAGFDDYKAKAEEFDTKVGELGVERDEAKAEALRYKVALENGLSSDDIQFLTGDNEESLTALAQRLAAKPVEKPGTGTHVPSEGNSPKDPGSLDEQIAAAQANGDTSKVQSLKAQKLIGIRNNSK